MFTRKQYLSNECTHEQYYSQFVQSWMADFILHNFTVDALKENWKRNEGKLIADSPVWNDMLFELIDKRTGKHVRNTAAMFGHTSCTVLWNFDRREIDRRLKAAGDFPSLAGYVCTFLQAANQLLTNLNQKENG